MRSHREIHSGGDVAQEPVTWEQSMVKQMPLFQDLEDARETLKLWLFQGGGGNKN